MSDPLESQRERLGELNPRWRTLKLWEADRKKMVGYMQAEGFKDHEIAGIYDARALLFVYKAMLFDHAKAAKFKARLARRGHWSRKV